MKRILAIGLAITLLAACQSKPVNRQEQLNQMKKQRDQLNDKIAALEAQLGDSSQAGGKVVAVSVTKLEPSSFKNYIEVQGAVDAQNNVVATAEAAGVVTGIYVKTGQHVSKGQVLAQLDDKVVQNGIAQLKNQLDYAKNIYDRQKNLWDQNIGTEVQLLTYKNNYENLKKQIDVQQSQLDMYKVKSPINGTVDAVDIKVGQALTPGIPAIRVVSTDDLKVKGEVGESYASQINQQEPVLLIFPDIQDTLNTRLSYVSRVVDPSSRSFDVEIRLPSSNKYHPNMIALIKVQNYTNDHAIVVPVNVIQKSEDGNYVYVNENNKAKRIKITEGRNYNGNVEIISGLKEGDSLITTGFEDLDDGDSLQIVQ